MPPQDHLPQAYDQRVQGYCNLDGDLVIDLTMLRGDDLKVIDVRFTPLHSVVEVPKAEVAKEVAKGPPLANPGPMALFAFGITTMMLMLIETGITEHSAINLVYGYSMFHGGVVQLVVGFIEIRRNNLFGATAFAGYGAFWMGWSLTNILQATGVIPVAAYPAGKCAYLVLWGIFTAILFVQTLHMNRCLQGIFSTLVVTFILLAGGQYSKPVQVAGAAFGMLCVAIVFYTATAELYNDLGNMKLPLFHVHGARAEFGNSHPGRGEILTAQDPAGLIPLRARRGPKDASYVSLTAVAANADHKVV